jgi:hypothetical protein
MGLILLIILVLLLLGGLPSWPYSRSWGYGPSGLLGLLLIILLVLLFLNMIPWGWGSHVPWYDKLGARAQTRRGPGYADPDHAFRSGERLGL